MIEPTQQERQELENILDKLMQYHVSAETVHDGSEYEIIIRHTAVEKSLTTTRSAYPEHMIITAERVLEWIEGSLPVYPTAKELIDAVWEWEGMK